MAEGARLESVYTLTRIEGSNPSLSAKSNWPVSFTGLLLFAPGLLSHPSFLHYPFCFLQQKVAAALTPAFGSFAWVMTQTDYPALANASLLLNHHVCLD